MRDENLTPEEIERIKKEHLELLIKKDVEARNRVKEAQEKYQHLFPESENQTTLTDEDQQNLENDPRYVLVEDDNGNKTYVLREKTVKRTRKKKIRKKHTRNFKSFARDYLSIVFIILVMVILAYYAYKLTP